MWLNAVCLFNCDTYQTFNGRYSFTGTRVAVMWLTSQSYRLKLTNVLKHLR